MFWFCSDCSWLSLKQFTWPKNFVLERYYFHRRVCVCVCVSVCVCLCLKVYLDYLKNFRWNLAGRCIIRKARLFFKMREITLVEQELQLPYFTMFSGKVLKTLQSTFYHLVDSFELWNNIFDRTHTSISLLKQKFQRIWSSEF